MRDPSPFRRADRVRRSLMRFPFGFGFRQGSSARIIAFVTHVHVWSPAASWAYQISTCYACASASRARMFGTITDALALGTAVSLAFGRCCLGLTARVSAFPQHQDLRRWRALYLSVVLNLRDDELSNACAFLNLQLCWAVVEEHDSYVTTIIRVNNSRTNTYMFLPS